VSVPLETNALDRTHSQGNELTGLLFGTTNGQHGVSGRCTSNAYRESSTCSTCGENSDTFNHFQVRKFDDM
jgi:hypothetical protein